MCISASKVFAQSAGNLIGVCFREFCEVRHAVRGAGIIADNLHGFAHHAMHIPVVFAVGCIGQVDRELIHVDPPEHGGIDVITFIIEDHTDTGEVAQRDLGGRVPAMNRPPIGY